MPYIAPYSSHQVHLMIIIFALACLICLIIQLLAGYWAARVEMAPPQRFIPAEDRPD